LVVGAGAAKVAQTQPEEARPCPSSKPRSHGQILVVRMNRPERLNALNHEMRDGAVAKAWTAFRHR
jgi:enoyl-CoA hydratase/carnithine racemase